MVECPQRNCDMWGRACTHVLYDLRCDPNLDKFTEETEETEEIEEAHQLG